MEEEKKQHRTVRPQFTLEATALQVLSLHNPESSTLSACESKAVHITIHFQ